MGDFKYAVTYDPFPTLFVAPDGSAKTTEFLRRLQFVRARRDKNPAHDIWMTTNTIAVRRLKLPDYDWAAWLHAAQNRAAIARATENIFKTEEKFFDEEGLYDFQKAGVAALLTHKGLLLADEMGLGKTVQAARAIKSLPDLSTILVICPAAVKYNWQEELARWGEVEAEVMNGKKGPRPEKDVVIINYDILHTRLGQLHEVTRLWDCIVLDEAHYIKSSRTQRTKAVFALKGKQRWALTGTPLLNRPAELYSVLHWLDPLGWTHRRHFELRYCAALQGKWGWDASGSSREEELASRLESTILLRRKKAQVLTSLPPKRRQVLALEPTATLERTSSKIWASLGVSGSEDRDAFDILKLKGVRKAHFEEMSKLRKQLGIDKLPFVVKHIQAVLESTEDQVIVFAHHRTVMDGLFDALRKEHSAVVVHGGTSAKARSRAVEKFQSGDARVFIGQIQAAGVGITLTAAPLVIFAELDWSPAVNVQAEDRAHRIGQKKPVLIQYLVVEHSLDARIARALQEKTHIASDILD